MSLQLMAAMPSQRGRSASSPQVLFHTASTFGGDLRSRPCLPQQMRQPRRPGVARDADPARESCSQVSPGGSFIDVLPQAPPAGSAARKMTQDRLGHIPHRLLDRLIRADDVALGSDLASAT